MILFAGFFIKIVLYYMPIVKITLFIYKGDAFMKHSASRSVQPEFNEVVKLETQFNEEQKRIWSKAIRVEKLKKETSTRKTLLLRQTTTRLN